MRRRLLDYTNVTTKRDAEVNEELKEALNVAFNEGVALALEVIGNIIKEDQLNNFFTEEVEKKVKSRRRNKELNEVYLKKISEVVKNGYNKN